MSLKGKEVSKVKSRNENAETGSESQMPESRYLLGLALISQGMADSAVCLSSQLFSGLAGSPLM